MKVLSYLVVVAALVTALAPGELVALTKGNNSNEARVPPATPTMNPVMVQNAESPDADPTKVTISWQPGEANDQTGIIVERQESSGAWKPITTGSSGLSAGTTEFNDNSAFANH